MSFIPLLMVFVCIGLLWYGGYRLNNRINDTGNRTDGSFTILAYHRTDLDRLETHRTKSEARIDRLEKMLTDMVTACVQDTDNRNREIRKLNERCDAIERGLTLVDNGIDIPGIYSKCLSVSQGTYQSRIGEVVRLILDHLKLDAVSTSSVTTPSEFKLVPVKGKKR